MNNKEPTRTALKLKMSDLARMAGVSKSTVSRALSDSALINPETRDKIQALAREHNYRLDTQARNFRLKQSLTIAVLIPSADDAKWQISDPFFLELLGGIAMSLSERGHDMLLSGVSLHADNWREQGVAKLTCDGLIVIGQANIHDRLQELADSFPPLVVWGAQLPDQNYCTVGSDNRLGGELAVAHLLAAGCRRIVFLGDWTLPEGAQRHQGYLDALKAAAVARDPALELHCEASKDAGYRAIRELRASAVPFDGVFASSDTLAMAAISALADLGVSVPGEVGVVGYDDISLAAYYRPSLTSVHQDRALGGRLLVEKLLALVDGDAVESALLPTHLAIRMSSRR